MAKRIFLYGAPASGKTTLGRNLAARLGAAFVDLDAAIVSRRGCSIPEIFARDGEGVFRDIEAAALAAVIDETEKNDTVIALGGGTLLRAANRVLAEATGTVFCLEAPDAAELARRIGSAAGSRPLGDKARERAPHYASFPHRIAAAFAAADDSLVVVGTGIAPALLEGFPCVADDKVAAIYAERVPAPVTVIPSGEEHKTPTTVIGLWHAFAAAGLGRRDTVAALGGGVTGDLTGFAAATWMRGIDWINFPTTLLSMVDASTGGKTGCDLPEGKNLAGAFHAPKLVVIDTAFLATLPPAVLAEGRAEMIKHEAIGGIPGIEGTVPTAQEIAANLMVKVGIVREDPYEKLGRRMLLNCGHTVGHAVEQLSGYAISHGAAVAIGCVAEARLAVRFGLAPTAWPDEFAARFAAAGLPTEIPAPMTEADLIPVMRGDKKKAKGGIVTFALPCGWGDVRGVRVSLANGMIERA
ncbi:MAG: bifunctional shikimate kinase/3-dehydroquinate synthase [Kiritimatiellia bacterium]